MTTMLPIFSGDERRQRRINLGGVLAVASHEEVLQKAKANREERQQARRRHEAATRIQALWRGTLCRKHVKEELKYIFDQDMTSTEAMRCLVIMKNDEERLGAWSEAVTSMGEVSLLQLATGPQRESWLILIRQLATMLLRSVAVHPLLTRSLKHLEVLNILLSPSTIDRVLPSEGAPLSQDITSYLLNHEFYQLLKTTTETIPLGQKSCPTLPLLVPLFTAPLSIFFDTASYLPCFRQTLQNILTIPLLPNRLPLASLSQFSAHLPLQSFDQLSQVLDDIISPLPILAKVHLLANLAAFMPPRYAQISATSFETFLSFLVLLLMGLPSSVFSEPSKPSGALQLPWTNGDDENSEDDDQVEDGDNTVHVELDTRTRSRLQTLGTPNHITALLKAAKANTSIQMTVFSFLMPLYTFMPDRRDNIFNLVAVTAGKGFIRELYRSHVRSSPLGKSDDPKALEDPSQAASWLALLFLTDLYTHTLLTMSDDEFFAKSHATTSSSTMISEPRNPLTVDEVISFSRQLMVIAFTLYWNESQPGVLKGQAPGTIFSWIAVRDKLTVLLQAIHARDSRRPFTPPNHWLLSSKLDMTSFVETAAYEEQSLPFMPSLPSIPPLFPRRSRPSRPSRRAVVRNRIAQFSPRLGLLNNIPFAIPFETRVQIFRNFVANDMVAQTGSTDRYHRGRRVRTKTKVRRGHIAEDGFDKLGNANLKGLVEIAFIDQFGQHEAGIDGGGVFKEFFTELCKEVFDTERGLWLTTKNNELYPNPHTYAKGPHSLDWYRFIGRILGKALYEGILVDVAFAGFFLAKWLGRHSYLDDLASLDLELYNGLLYLKNCADPEELSLTFAVVEEDLGVARTIDLIPNGSNVSVTQNNRLQYIYLISHYRLTKQIRPQSNAFFQGLSEMIDPKWIEMFNQQELQILIGGVNSPIDLDDLRKNTQYGGLYNDSEETIVSFWRVVETFNHEQRRALLRFATSCSRPPLLGFKELNPLFAIRDSGSDQNRLPTSSTCVNLLKLPRYTSDAVLRTKLLQAIMSGAGFDLS